MQPLPLVAAVAFRGFVSINAMDCTIDVYPTKTKCSLSEPKHVLPLQYPDHCWVKHLHVVPSVNDMHGGRLAQKRVRATAITDIIV